MEIKLNKNAVLLELLHRVRENEQGVRGYLHSAGIDVAEGGITIQHLNSLRQLNPAVFEEMLRFLYPEMKDYANADGEEGATTTLKTSDGSKWSATDWTNMVGTVLGGAGSILGMLNINGNSNAMASAAAYNAETAALQAEAEKKQLRKTIAIVCAGFVIIVVAAVLIFKHRK